MTLEQFAAANPSADPAETIRNYRNLQHLDLLRSGEYDEVAPEIDNQLQAFAQSNGIEVNFNQRNDRRDLEYVSQYSQDPAAQAAARTYLAVDDPKIKETYGDPIKYDEVLSSARAAVEQSINPIERNKARRAALDSGDTPFAVFQDPTTGEERLDVSPALKDLAGNDEALAAYFEANPDLDVSRIGEVRQKLRTPDGYTAPAFQIDRQHDWLGAFSKVLSEDRNIARKVSDLRTAADKGIAPNEALLDQIDTELGAYGMHGDPSPEAAAERKAFIQDFINMSAAPEVDETNLDNNIRTLSTGQKVLPMAVMLQRPLFDKVVESPSIPEPQRQMLKENRDTQLSAMAPEMFKTIAANRQEFPKFMQERKDKGMPNAAILDEWMADPENYSQARSWIGGAGESILDAAGALVLYPAAMAGSESARKAMADLQKSDMDRKNYAQMFGKNLDVGYDIMRLIAPVAADVSVSLLTGGAATAAVTSKNVIKTGIKSALKGAIDAGVYKAFTRGAATQSVDQILDTAGKNLARKFVKSATTASYLGTAFNRSAGSTYVQLYSQLSEEKNPDGSNKYTPEKAREIALNHGLIQGSLTALLTAGFSFMGAGGIESIYGNMSKKQLGRIFEKVKQDFDKLAPSVREGLDMANADKFLTSVVKKAMRPVIAGTPIKGKIGAAAIKNPVTAELAIGTLGEGAEEGLDTFAGYFNQQIATGDEINIADAFKQAGYAAMLGGVMGAGVVGVREATAGQADIDTEALTRRTALYDIAAKLDAASSPRTAEAVRRFAVEGFPTSPSPQEGVPEGAGPEGAVPAPSGPAVAGDVAAEPITTPNELTPTQSQEAAPVATGGSVSSSAERGTDLAGKQGSAVGEDVSAGQTDSNAEAAPINAREGDTGLSGENVSLTEAQEEQAVASSMPGQKVRIGAPKEVKQRVVKKAKINETAPQQAQDPEASSPSNNVGRDELLVEPVTAGSAPTVEQSGMGEPVEQNPAREDIPVPDGRSGNIFPQVGDTVAFTTVVPGAPATGVIESINPETGKAKIRAGKTVYPNATIVAPDVAGTAASVPDEAINRWIASSSDISLHAEDILNGAPEPGSLSGKTLRGYAQSILEGVQQSPLNSVPLYRGATGSDRGLVSWTSDRKTAEYHANKSGGKVIEVPPGTIQAYEIPNSPEKEFVALPFTPQPEQGLTEIPNIAEALYDHPDTSNATEDEAQLVADALNPELSPSPENALNEVGGWDAARKLVQDLMPDVDVSGFSEQMILDIAKGHSSVIAMTTRDSINAVNRQLQNAPRPVKPFTPENSPVLKELKSLGFDDGIVPFLQNVVKSAPPHQKAVAKLMLEFKDMLARVPVSRVYLPESTFAGAFVPETGQILINIAVPGPRGAIDTVLHELIHAAVTDSITNPNPAQQKILVRLERIRQNVQKKADARGMNYMTYGLSSMDEFMTHFFTSPAFQAEVSALTPKGERNWVQVIIDTIRDLLHGRLRTRQEVVTQQIMSDMIAFTRDAAAGTYGPTPRMEALMQLPEGDVRNTARFIELTRGVTPENVEQWRESNPEAYQELRRMREEVLRDAGWDRKLLHGSTGSNWTEYDLKKAGSAIDSGFLGRGIYLTTSSKVAQRHSQLGESEGKVFDLFAKLTNPFQWGRKTLGARGIRVGQQLPSEIHDEVMRLANERAAARKPETVSNNWLEIGADPEAILEEEVSGAITEVLVSKGYDGVISTIGEDLEVVVFDPNQIKSTEPIAFDSDNQLILPHRWADAGSPDIRFQLPEGDGDVERVDFDNANELVSTLSGETGDAIRQLVQSSPKLADALSQIKVVAGPPSFDGKVIRLRVTDNTQRTKAHEVTHAILDKAIDEIPSFKKNVKDVRSSILTEPRGKEAELIRTIFRQALTNYDLFGKRTNVSFSKYFADNMNSIARSASVGLSNTRITDADMRLAYALTGEHEFLAAIMSDEGVREIAKRVLIGTQEESLFRKLMNAIKKMLGMRVETPPKNQLERVTKLIEDVINNDAYAPGPYERSYGRSFQLPDAEEAFNNEIQKYVTGNWPADAQGRFEELKRYIESFYAGAGRLFTIENEWIDGHEMPPGINRSERGAGASSRLRGVDEIVIFTGKGNLLPIAENPGLTEFEAKRRIGLVLHEELDHAAYLESVKRRVGPGGDINAQVTSDLKKMVAEIQASSENPSQSDAVNRALYASMAVYDPRVPEFTEAVDVVSSIGKLDLRDQFEMTQEFMRQVIQLRRQGTITESVLQKVSRVISDWFNARVQEIRNVMNDLGMVSPTLEKSVNDMTAILDEIEGKSPRLQTPEAPHTVDLVRSIAAGFTPDDIDLPIDFDALTEATTDLTPINREHYISATVNRALSEKAGFDALGEDVTPDERERLVRMHQMITSGNTLVDDIAFYRSNPTSMARLARFLEGAVKSIWQQLKNMFDQRSAVYLDRLVRELNRARNGYELRAETKMFDPDDIHFQLPVNPNPLSPDDPTERRSYVEYLRAQDGNRVMEVMQGDRARLDETGVKAWFRKVFGSKYGDLIRPMAEAKTSDEHMRDTTGAHFTGLFRKMEDVFQDMTDAEIDQSYKLLSFSLGDTSPMLTPSEATRINDIVQDRYQQANDIFNAESAQAAEVKRKAVQNARKAFSKDLKSFTKAEAQIKEAYNKEMTKLHNERSERNRKAQEFEVDAKMKSELAEGQKRRLARDSAQEQLNRDFPKVGKWSQEMRDTLTDLQDELLRRYGEDHPMFLKIDRSRGIYLVRSFAVHNDPALAMKVINDEEYIPQRTALIGYFEDQLATEAVERLKRKKEFKSLSEAELESLASEERITREMTRVRATDPAFENATDDELRAVAELNVSNQAQIMFEDFLLSHTGSNVSGSDADIRTNIHRFMRKKQLPPEILDALLEIKDPVTNAFTTFNEVSNLVHSHRMLGELTRIGEQSGIFVTKEEVDADRRKYHGWQPLVSADVTSRAYAPLAGKYAAPEHVEAFRAVFHTGPRNAQSTADKSANVATRFLTGLAGSALAVTTLGNPGYYIRNPIGNTIALLRQGAHPFSGDMITAFRTTWDAAFSTLRDDAEANAFMLRMSALGVVNNGAHIQYVKELLLRSVENPSGAMDALQSMIGQIHSSSGDAVGKIRIFSRDFVGSLGDFAQVTEEFALLFLTMRNITMLTKAGYGNGIEVEQEAARRAKAVMFTKSEASQGVKSFTRHGAGALVGPFLRFKAEVVRSYVNTYRLAWQDINSGNPVLRDHGIKVMASAAAVDSVLTVALPFIFAAITGIGDDEDRAIRASMPVYDQDTSFLFTRWGGKLYGVNLTYLNPGSLLGDPVVSGIRAVIQGDPENIADIATRLVTNEVLGENIAAGRLLDVKRNRDETTGMQIWMDTDDWHEKVWKAADHLAGAYKPVVYKTIKKAFDARDRPDAEDQPWYYQPSGIMAAMFLPTKPTPIDPEVRVYRAFRKVNAANNSLWQITAKMKNPAGFNVNDVAETYEELQQANFKVQEQMHQYIQGFIKLGLPAHTVMQKARDAGMSRDKLGYAAKGLSQRKVLSPDSIQEIRKIDPAVAERWLEEQRKYPMFRSTKD